MRKHGPEGHISNALDALGRSVELVVNDDTAALVRLDADGLEVEALSDGSATDSDEDDVGLELGGLAYARGECPTEDGRPAGRYRVGRISGRRHRVRTEIGGDETT